MSNPRPLFFHHLPKTAGTSFHRVLLDVYGESRVSPKVPGWRLAEAVRTHADRAAISGHIRAMPGDVLPAGYYTVTVLREPLDRFLSEFYFSKYDYRVNRADLDEMKQLDLDEFLERAPGGLDYAWNLQVETLYPYCWKAPGAASPADKLKAAKDALELFDCVGVQEEFGDFVHVVSFDLGWPPVQAIPRENATTRRVSPMELPEAIRRVLMERTALDAELYAFARALFRRKRRRVLLDCVASRHRGSAEGTATPLDARFAGGPSPPTAAGHGRAEPIVHVPAEFGDRRVEIAGVTIAGSLHDARAMLAGELMTIALRLRAHEAIDNFTAGFSIHDDERRLAFGTNTRLLGYRLAITPGSEQLITLTLRNDLPIGKYTLGAALHLGSSHLVGCFHWLERAAEFEIVGNIGDHFEGRMKLYPSVAVASGNEGVLSLSRESETGNEFLQRLERPSSPLREFLANIRAVSDLPTTFTPGDELAVELEVQNTGTEEWHAAGIRPVRIGFHWFDSDWNWLDYEGIRTTLTHDIQPGEKSLHWCVLRVPEYMGPVILTWTLVQEEVAWFDDRNSESALRLECQIAK